MQKSLHYARFHMSGGLHPAANDKDGQCSAILNIGKAWTGVMVAMLLPGLKRLLWKWGRNKNGSTKYANLLQGLLSEAEEKGASAARKSKENVKWYPIAFVDRCRKFAFVFVYIVQAALAIFAPKKIAFCRAGKKWVKFNLRFADEPNALLQCEQKTEKNLSFWFFSFEMCKCNLLFEIEVQIKRRK